MADEVYGTPADRQAGSSGFTSTLRDRGGLRAAGAGVTQRLEALVIAVNDGCGVQPHAEGGHRHGEAVRLLRDLAEHAATS